jgi:hypothetical protein
VAPQAVQPMFLEIIFVINGNIGRGKKNKMEEVKYKEGILEFLYHNDKQKFGIKEAEYKIGQVVFFYDNNTPRVGIVEEIIIKIKADSFEYQVKCPGADSQLFKEHHLFDNLQKMKDKELAEFKCRFETLECAFHLLEKNREKGF